MKGILFGLFKGRPTGLSSKLLRSASVWGKDTVARAADQNLNISFWFWASAEARNPRKELPLFFLPEHE